MQRNLSFSHGMTGLFWGLLVALGGLLLPIAEAEAQPIRGDRCDSVYIDARKGDDGCCFSFLVENHLDNIDRIVMTTSGGYDFSDASGPRSADVSFQGTTATNEQGAEGTTQA